MMMTAPNSTNAHSKPPPNSPARRGRGKRARGKLTITAAERWLKISRNVYGRVQKRGFVGGDPFEDLSEAVREVDEQYATDIQGLLSLTDPTELVEQFRSLFAGYGLGKNSLDRLLELNRDTLEKLAASNRRLFNGQPERSAQRTSLLRNATDEAMQTLQSLARSASNIEKSAHLPQPTKAVSNVLSRLAALANSAEELSEEAEPVIEEVAQCTPHAVEIHGAVVKAYDGWTAVELAGAPVSALKGVSVTHAAKLKSAFGIETIRDMAQSGLIERAQGIVTLADEENRDLGQRKRGSATRGESLRDIAEGPLERIEGISSRQARIMRESFRIGSVRSLANNRFFRVSRAIVTLADLED
jgi:hypothetical protein